MDAKLPVDAGTLDAGEDAQVGGEPRGVWREGGRNAVVRRTRRQETVEELAGLHACAARRRNAISHRLHMSSQQYFQPDDQRQLLAFLLRLKLECKKKMHQGFQMHSRLMSV